MSFVGLMFNDVEVAQEIAVNPKLSEQKTDVDLEARTHYLGTCKSVELRWEGCSQ